MGSPIDLCRRICFNTLKNILFVILRSGSREPILANSLGFVGSVSLVFVCLFFELKLKIESHLIEV